MTGYLHHGVAPDTCRTEAVAVKHEYADRYLVRFEGRWRRVHVTLNRLYIVWRGKRITIHIEGL